MNRSLLEDLQAAVPKYTGSIISARVGAPCANLPRPAGHSAPAGALGA